ncbi:MAG: AAA family ATPase [Dehalococcoidia bacterium]|jgi:dephospho-CoA kinase
MNIRVVGTVGRIGSGKDEILKYLYARYGIPYISTGDIVRHMADKEGLEPTRENLEEISERCFRKLGKGCFVRMVAEEIIKRKWKIAGISGIRAPADVRVLKEHFGDSFTMIRVEVTDPRLRFKRLQLRHEGRDAATYKAFLVQDKNEEDAFKISKTEAMADYTIKNDGSLADLHRRIGALIRAGHLIVK